VVNIPKVNSGISVESKQQAMNSVQDDFLFMCFFAYKTDKKIVLLCPVSKAEYF